MVEYLTLLHTRERCVNEFILEEPITLKIPVHFVEKNPIFNNSLEIPEISRTTLFN